MPRSRNDPAGKPAPGRPRDTGATGRILRAALDLGDELGFAALTVEGIAARAGVGKTTIYRRWPNVWALLADAVMAEASDVAPIADDRPTARECFLLSMTRVARAFRGPHGAHLRPVIGQAQLDPTLRVAIADRWLGTRRRVSRQIVQRGIDSGELRTGLDPDTVLDALYGPLYHRLLLPYDGDAIRLGDAYVRQLVDTVFDGLAGKKR